MASASRVRALAAPAQVVLSSRSLMWAGRWPGKLLLQVLRRAGGGGHGVGVGGDRIVISVVMF